MSDIQKMAKQSETFPAIMVETQCQVCPEYGYCDTCAQGQFRHWMRLDIQYKDLERRLAVAVEALKAVQRELGVPQPGYPAPVAHAYEIAKFGVEQIGEKEKGNLAPPTEVER